jgi:hypothetical protein
VVVWAWLMGVMVAVARSEGNLSQAWCISSCAALVMLDGGCGVWV